MLFSYIEVNNKFYSTLEDGKQCSSNNDYKNNHYLLTHREKIIELCNSTQEQFEDEIDLLFKNLTKKETYINDLFDIFFSAECQKFYKPLAKLAISHRKIEAIEKE